MKTVVRVMLVMALSCLSGLTACGESDDDQVRSVIDLVERSDPARCDLMTKRFLARYYRGRVKECVSDTETTAWGMGEVSIDGHKATVDATYAKLPVKLTLVKQDDQWKVDTFEGLEEGAEEEPSAPRATIRKGLDPGETVKAYYQAIEDADAAALCGLVTERYATRLNGERRPDPISACVSELQNEDWAETKKSAAGVTIESISKIRSRAFVHLSNRKTASLEKGSDGRWLVSDIRRP